MSSVSSVGAAAAVHHAQHAHKPPAKSAPQDSKPVAPAAKPSPHKVDVKA